MKATRVFLVVLAFGANILLGGCCHCPEPTTPAPTATVEAEAATPGATAAEAPEECAVGEELTSHVEIECVCGELRSFVLFYPQCTVLDSFWFEEGETPTLIHVNEVREAYWVGPEVGWPSNRGGVQASVTPFQIIISFPEGMTEASGTIQFMGRDGQEGWFNPAGPSWRPFWPREVELIENNQQLRLSCPAEDPS